jgi:hypothetical protein
MEYNHVGLYEETSKRVSDIGASKLWVWDHFVFLFLREGTQYQSSRDDTRERGLSPSAMQVGDVVSMIGGREDHQGL